MAKEEGRRYIYKGQGWLRCRIMVQREDSFRGKLGEGGARCIWGEGGYKYKI